MPRNPFLTNSKMILSLLNFMPPLVELEEVPMSATVIRMSMH